MIEGHSKEGWKNDFQTGRQNVLMCYVTTEIVIVFSRYEGMTRQLK